jgi:hypothetical protein
VLKAKGFVMKSAVLGCLAFLLFPFSAQAQYCKPVLDGSILNFAFECFNDSTAMVVDSSQASDGDWQYSFDSEKDGVSFGQIGGGDFEIYGVALRETQDEVYLVINGNLPIQGFDSKYAQDGNIGWGDLFINLSKEDFLTQSDKNALFAIRFAETNDSHAEKVGVYADSNAVSVTAENSGFTSWQHYADYVHSQKMIPVLGDFGENQTYIHPKISSNVIDKHNFLGEIQFLSMPELDDLKYDQKRFAGSVTIAFHFAKRLIIDECGVLGGDGSSCRDCAGIACGDTQIDQCGICGGDGSSCLDCSGVPFGNTQVDACGVCGGDDSSCADCTGTPNGSAVVDACSVCNGDGSSCADCAGVPNGNSALDICGVCGGDGSSCLDCAGTPEGQATIDACGICGGDSSSCLDCAGVPQGSSIVDQCGVCGGDGSSCLDCAGNPNGNMVVDSCGVCGGDSSSCMDCGGMPNGGKSVDICGICGGDGSTCLDCSGTAFGAATVDQCGVCGGDGTSCLDCDTKDHRQTLFELDGAGAALKILAYREAKILRSRHPKKLIGKRLAKELREQADALHLEVWSLAWSFPASSDSCVEGLVASGCEANSNADKIQRYTSALNEFVDLLKVYARKIRHLDQGNRRIREVMRTLKHVQSSAEQDLKDMPVDYLDCQ